jgi:ParB family chromosome partitioning protein
MKKTTPLKSKINRDVFFGTSADLPQIVEVDLAKVTRNPNQPRKTFSEESLKELASSIERHGLIQPITVKKDGAGSFLLVAGERRFRAFEMLEKPTIPAIITTGDTDEIALIENIQREDLNPLEEAEAMSLMMEKHQYTQEQLGAIIGKAQNTVSQALGLLKLPEKIRDEYRVQPTVSKSLLMEVARLKSEAEQLAAWETIKEGRLTTVRAARTKHKAPQTDPKPMTAAQVLSSARRFVQTLETAKGSGDVILDKESYRELVDLRNRLTELIDELSPTQQLLNE